MQVSLKTAFSILDGRLSTGIEDVYKMLNYIFDDNLYTHQLPVAMRKVKEINPLWFSWGVEVIDEIKKKNNTDDFKELMEIIDRDFPDFKIELGQINYKIGFFEIFEK